MAKECLKLGVDIINDVSGGRYDPEILKVVAKYDCGYIYMYSRGTTINMNNLATYKDTVSEVIKEIEICLKNCRKAGINEYILSLILVGISSWTLD